MGRSGSRTDDDDRRAYREAARNYSAWIHSLEEAEAGEGKYTAEERAVARKTLAELRRLSDGKRGDENLLSPLEFVPRADKRAIDDDAPNPAQLAADKTAFDDWKQQLPIVDFESVSSLELQDFCDHLGIALAWATKTQPDLMQMGARWLTIFRVLRPQLIGAMKLPLPAPMIQELQRELAGRDPLATGKFFRRPLAWVRKCTSLVQLGKRAYSATYVLRGDLINSATCAAIGSLDNRTRQAANKPIQEFRDTFSGIKSLPMRGNTTRLRCKEAQEKS